MKRSCRQTLPFMFTMTHNYCLTLSNWKKMISKWVWIIHYCNERCWISQIQLLEMISRYEVSMLLFVSTWINLLVLPASGYLFTRSERTSDRKWRWILERKWVLRRTHSFGYLYGWSLEIFLPSGWTPITLKDGQRRIRVLFIHSYFIHATNIW